MAAMAGTADCVSLLLAARADLDGFDEYGRTPLHIAAWRNNPEMAKQLIEAKADVNLRVGDYTPEPGMTDLKGMTPLTLALGEKYLEVAAVLLDTDVLLDSANISHLVGAEGPTAIECLEKIPKEARFHNGSTMQRAHIREQLRVILAKGEGSCFDDDYITLEGQNLFTRPAVQASLKYIPALCASDACNPELLKSLAYTANDEVFHTHTVAALVQAAWMQTRLATAGEVFVSLLMLPLLCHASFTLRHEQPHFADPSH